MGRMKFVDLFKTNNFVSKHVFRMLQNLSGKLNFWFWIIFFTSRTKKKKKKKKKCVLSKNGQNQNCRFLWDEQFYPLTFFRIVHSLVGKWIFWLCENHFWWIKPEPLVKNSWLTKLTFIFWHDKSVPKANPIDQFFQKLSCIHTDRQTDTIPKTIFSHSQSGSLKTWRFDEKRRCQILHKSLMRM